jgi:NTE family protein
MLKLLRYALLLSVVVIVALMIRGGFATRPVNPRLAHPYVDNGLQFEKLEHNRGNQEDLVILAFSGGGTRAAAFSYGVLQTLRHFRVRTSSGKTVRLLDEVDVITGVSGGSFTALAYGLYGEKLFERYEDAFLTRNVQGMLLSRLLNPLYWGALLSKKWGMSELAADLYDEILFHNATFKDLEREGNPAVVVGATELSTGSRIVFAQQNFDVMCADLDSFKLSRAAAASSAVPVVLSPLTINNYGGTCGYQEPDWLRRFAKSAAPPRPAGRILKRLGELEKLDDAVKDPYFHLVDGGVSDNLGLRGVLDFMETFEALRTTGYATPLDHVRRVIIFVVNSVSSPSTKWNMSENPPGKLSILLKATGVPIDRYANESVELLRDIDARWTMLRSVRDTLPTSPSRHPALNAITNAPNADIFVIDVSFQALKNNAERNYLNQLPTSFALPHEAVDRLRAAAASIILDSPDFRAAIHEAGAEAVDPIKNDP